MRPGELIPGDGPVPTAAPSRRAVVAIRNSGRFPAYIGSHFPVARASRALEFERDGLGGARLDLPAGASARIEAGETAELDVIWA
ncbi:MAG: urease subunit beta [Gaiellales bacterium]